MIRFLVHLVMMSLQATLIIAIIFGIRKLFSVIHISKKYVMLLWMIPFFFLIFPWKIPVPKGFWYHGAQDMEISGTQRLADTQTASDTQNQQEIQAPAAAEAFAGAGKLTDVRRVFGTMQQSVQELETDGTRSSSFGFLFAVWAVGMLIFMLYAVVSYWRLKERVRCRIRWNGSCADVRGDRVWLSDGIHIPMVLGYFRPCIYLPAGMKEHCAKYVIAHEHTHILRKDYFVKMSAYVITCIHWFNPAVWFAYFFMAKDMEMACDEETIGRIGMDRKKEYAAALLQLSAGNDSLFAAPPAFGTGDVKMRITNIMHYSKTIKRKAALAVLTGIFITGIFLTADMDHPVNPAAGVSAKTAGEKEAPAQKKSAAAEKKTSSDRTDRLTFKKVRRVFARQQVGKLDFHKYANGERDDLSSDALNYYIGFRFRYEGEDYYLGASHLKSTDQLSDVYITRISDSEMCWIYTKEDGKERYPNDLEKFLATKIKIEDWLTLELPDGYTLGSYQGNLGDYGGALIYPQSYSTIGEAFAPTHWMYAGFVGQVYEPERFFVFQDGKLDENYFPKSNHTTEEVVGADVAAVGEGWHTLMVYANHDLYTASEVGELEEKGIDTDSLETESEYWYFYFVKEGEERAYFLSLSAKEFSREEAVAVAETVRMADKGSR